MEQGVSKLDLLREEISSSRISRRSVLKRAATLGLTAPVIAGLLAACGDDDDDDEPTQPAATATGSGGAASPTSGEATATTAEASPTAAAATATTSGSGPTATTAEASPTASTGSTGTPGHGRGVADLLRILYWQAPTNLNVHFSQGTKDSAAASLVLEPLLEVDGDGNLQPILAAEVPSLENGGVAADGMSVTYNLKQGVLWSDGDPFTAEDVRFTWQYVTNTDTAATSFAAYAPIVDVEVVDDYTVTLHYDQPAPAWFGSFSTGFGGQVLPQHLLQDFIGTAARDAEFNLAPIGTGPYKVKEFRPGDVVLYELNENYREADKPYFKEIEFKGGGDATSAARAGLQSGETDWAWNLQVEKAVLEDLANSDIGVLLVTPGTSNEQILPNFADPNTETNGAKAEPTTQHPFLTDLKVRQAFNMACDRDTIATEVYGVAGTATATAINAPTKFASPNNTYTFDTDQANALLDEAGWALDGDVRKKDGVEMSVLYQTTVNPVRQKTQEIVKAGWTQLGVKVELKSIDAGVFFSSDAGNPDTAAHFYADFEMFTNGPVTPYPVLDYAAGFKSNEPDRDLPQQANQWAGANYMRWVDEEYNALWEQALIELDPDKQVELFVAMNDRIVDQVANMPLIFRLTVQAASNKLKGYDSYGFSPWSPDVRNIADWYFEE